MVLPQPEGPSRVISSPRRTRNDTAVERGGLAETFRDGVELDRDASPVGRLFTAAADAEGGRSAAMLNVQYLCETEERHWQTSAASPVTTMYMTEIAAIEGSAYSRT